SSCSIPVAKSSGEQTEDDREDHMLTLSTLEKYEFAHAVLVLDTDIFQAFETNSNLPLPATENQSGAHVVVPQQETDTSDARSALKSVLARVYGVQELSVPTVAHYILDEYTRITEYCEAHKDSHASLLSPEAKSFIFFETSGSCVASSEEPTYENVLELHQTTLTNSSEFVPFHPGPLQEHVLSWPPRA
ncbi:unnamed protein product, partial [Amoebophrya sp. A120]